MFFKLNVSEDSFKKKKERGWGVEAESRSVEETAKRDEVMENTILYEIKKRGHTDGAFLGISFLKFSVHTCLHFIFISLIIKLYTLLDLIVTAKVNGGNAPSLRDTALH